jgi:hypothetical protein
VRVMAWLASPTLEADAWLLVSSSRSETTRALGRRLAPRDLIWLDLDLHTDLQLLEKISSAVLLYCRPAFCALINY